MHRKWWAAFCDRRRGVARGLLVKQLALPGLGWVVLFLGLE